MAENCPINIEPFAQSGVLKQPNLISLNYTNQDFWSMKSRLIDFLNERFGVEGSELPNTFNDLVESSIAIMLIENWAFLADTLSFKIDQISNELFIDTVTQIENAFRLAKLVGFDPLPPIAARSLWLATINNPLSTDLLVESPISIDVVSDGEPITIELFQADSENNPIFGQDIIIPAGATSNQSIVGLEGRTTEEFLEGTGDVGQSFQLRFFPVIFDSVRVTIDGVQWNQVDFFTDSQPRREYRVEFDSNYNAFVIFGNNRAGLIPSQGSSIEIEYRVGGGQIGNIVTGFVTTQTQVTIPGFGVPVAITFTNYTRGEFGYDGDTVDDIRRKLPAFLRTQNRAVTGEDYKTLSDQFATAFHGKVGKSNAILRNSGCAGNIIDLYMLAQEGTDGLVEAGNELKVALNEEMNTKKMLTDFLCIRDGEIVSTDISIDVTSDKFFRKFELEVRENITQRVNSFFALNNWEFGKTLKESDLVRSLSDIDQANGFDITFTTNDPDNSGEIVTTEFFQIIRPDDVAISFVYV